GTDGFLVSNRDGAEQIRNRYTGDDLYAFSDFKYGLEGFALLQEKDGESPLEDAVVSLYEIDTAGNTILVEELENISDKYFFDLSPDKDYKIEVKKDGFSPSTEFVSTKNLMFEDTLHQDLYVDKTIVIAAGDIFDDANNEPIDEVLVSVVEILPSGEKIQRNTIKVTKGEPYNFPLKVDRRYELAFNADDYFKNTIPVSTYNLALDVDTIDNDIYLTKIEKNKSYELENILYDFGKATLRTESEEILDNLYKIMNDNPGIEIELAAHTDAIGSDAANMSLSQRRAQSCVDYLIEKGIAEYRLTAKGYGETTPIAPNEKEDGSDNPDGRQKNRRTEFSVVEM
ncbi:MAG: OmpA family protein, partial [Chitinophagales bacterium]